jgi:hypothetical protein
MHNKKEAEAFRDLIIGIIFALLSMIIIIDQSLQIIVKPKLYDGSLNDRGRYAMVFDAYDVIENDDGASIIFLGSSKMREAINGNLIEQINGDEVNIYNLAYAGERPYYRMIEIEQIIQAKPEIVVLELGPNSFSKMQNPISGQSLWIMRQLVSLSGNPAPQGMYYSQLTENDKYLLPSSQIEIADNLSTHFRQSIELTYSSFLDYEEKKWDCSINVQCAPYFKHDEFEQYLRYPPQFPNWLAQYRESGRTEIYYDKYLDSFYNHSLHTVEGEYNTNHRAYDFIIDSLVSEGIEVVIIALPYNPRAQNNAPLDHWEYVNNSIINYGENEEITLVDWFWEDWGEESFVDISHFSSVGEDEVARRISPILIEIINEE